MELKNHFFLSQDVNLGPTKWKQRSIDSWCLRTSPSLKVREIRSACGHLKGWLLGLPIGEQHIDNKLWEIQLSDTGFLSRLDEFESNLYLLGGRYLAIVFDDGHNGRVYLDAGGTLASVYDPTRRCMASTPALMPWAPQNELAPKIRDVTGQYYYWFPFGITSRAGVKRLLPNHYLDLEMWKMCRHWTFDSAVKELSIDAAAERVGRILKRHMHFAANNGGFYLPLTAGRDSRMLLACARRLQSNMTCYTVKRTDSIGGKVDVNTATKITKKLKIKHRVLEHRVGSAQELKNFELNVGGCVGISRKSFQPERKLGNMRRHMLFGAAGELARGYYARWEDRLDGQPTPELILKRAGFPLLPELIKLSSEWMISTKQKRFVPIMDLFYLENRVGCWASPMCYGHFYNTWFPLVHRQIFSAFWGISEEERLKSLLPERIVQLFWPELSKFSYNLQGGWRKWKRKILQAITSMPGLFLLINLVFGAYDNLLFLYTIYDI